MPSLLRPQGDEPDGNRLLSANCQNLASISGGKRSETTIWWLNLKHATENSGGGNRQ
jgi:hypothetical protein